MRTALFAKVTWDPLAAQPAKLLPRSLAKLVAINGNISERIHPAKPPAADPDRFHYQSGIIGNAAKKCKE